MRMRIAKVSYRLSANMSTVDMFMDLNLPREFALTLGWYVASIKHRRTT